MLKKKTLTILMLAALVLSACNFPLFKQADDEGEVDALATAVAETMQAINAGNPPGQDDDGESGSALPTITPLPTFTQAPVNLPPTQTPEPCNKAVFVSETIPDDTEFNPGENFTKSWTFRNVGTCTWNTNYSFVFSTGDQMGGPDVVSVPTTVAPETQVTISVDLTAPNDPGSYTGYWKLQADDDEQFGQVYVRVKTKDVLFAVTSVSYSMTDTSIEITCPSNEQVTIKGNITTNAGGTVKYRWQDSSGGSSSNKTITFDSPDTKTVEYSMVVPAAGNYWAKLFIAEPNNQLFGPQNFSATCTP